MSYTVEKFQVHFHDKGCDLQTVRTSLTAPLVVILDMTGTEI
jgi:hypothetical protein